MLNNMYSKEKFFAVGVSLLLGFGVALLVFFGPFAPFVTAGLKWPGPVALVIWAVVSLVSFGFGMGIMRRNSDTQKDKLFYKKWQNWLFVLVVALGAGLSTVLSGGIPYVFSSFLAIAVGMRLLIELPKFLNWPLEKLFFVKNRVQRAYLLVALLVALACVLAFSLLGGGVYFIAFVKAQIALHGLLAVMGGLTVFAPLAILAVVFAPSILRFALNFVGGIGAAIVYVVGNFLGLFSGTIDKKMGEIKWSDFLIGEWLCKKLFNQMEGSGKEEDVVEMVVKKMGKVRGFVMNDGFRKQVEALYRAGALKANDELRDADPLVLQNIVQNTGANYIPGKGGEDKGEWKVGDASDFDKSSSKNGLSFSANRKIEDVAESVVKCLPFLWDWNWNNEDQKDKIKNALVVHFTEEVKNNKTTTSLLQIQNPRKIFALMEEGEELIPRSALGNILAKARSNPPADDNLDNKGGSAPAPAGVPVANPGNAPANVAANVPANVPANANEDEDWDPQFDQQFQDLASSRGKKSQQPPQQHGHVSSQSQGGGSTYNNPALLQQCNPPNQAQSQPWGNPQGMQGGHGFAMNGAGGQNPFAAPQQFGNPQGMQGGGHGFVMNGAGGQNPFAAPQQFSNPQGMQGGHGFPTNSAGQGQGVQSWQQQAMQQQVMQQQQAILQQPGAGAWVEDDGNPFATPQNSGNPFL